MTEFQDVFQTIREGNPNTPDTGSDSIPGIPKNPVKPPDSYPEKNTSDICPDYPNMGGNALNGWPPKAFLSTLFSLLNVPNPGLGKPTGMGMQGDFFLGVKNSFPNIFKTCSSYLISHRMLRFQNRITPHATID